MLKAPQIRFCRASDGVRIAYATTGRGPAMIEVATWLNHLEFDWQSPIWRPRLVEMAKNYTMARYDGRGCGLSDRAVEDLSFDANLRDLEAVADAAGFKRFILLGCARAVGWRLPMRHATLNASAIWSCMARLLAAD
jgi:pimeloyl-ACP methyl ester carboxylesterase